MGLELAEAYPIARQLFLRADQLLDFSISQLAWYGPEGELNDTINTQPALLIHSIATLRVFQDLFPEFKPAFVAGHSMGELSALVAAGSLPFEGAVKLVRQRGELMKLAGEQSPGGMAAVLGADITTVEDVCEKASQGDEVVRVANDNCPGQVVISGSAPALERVMKIAQQSGIRKIRSLAVSIAAHSSLMTYAQEEFSQAVQQASITNPIIPVVGNVSAKSMTSADEIRSDLQAQLTSRVRWTESINQIASQGISIFIELGSGSVLSGLIRRIQPESQTFSLSTPQDFDRLLQEIQ